MRHTIKIIIMTRYPTVITYHLELAEIFFAVASKMGCNGNDALMSLVLILFPCRYYGMVFNNVKIK